MANFPTHITTSAVLGATYGTVAHVGYGLPLPSCLLAGGLCTIAGLLPDVDSDNAVILREILAFVAAVIPMLLLDRFRALGWNQESIVVASGVLYVVIRFGVGELIRQMTVHRGMWHSLPAAGIASLVVYYLCDCPDVTMRLFKTGGVTLGFVWHLVLDEVYAVDSGSGRVRVKRSFGTAFKLYGKNPVANVLAYGLLAGTFGMFYMRPADLPSDWGLPLSEGKVARQAAPQSGPATAPGDYRFPAEYGAPQGYPPSPQGYPPSPQGYDANPEVYRRSRPVPPPQYDYRAPYPPQMTPVP